jgi:hypothetical protein
VKKFQTVAAICAAAGAAAAANIAALEVNSKGGVEWACGGAGAEERAQIKLLQTEATASLLFITEGRGGYLADVDFVVRDRNGAGVLQGRADGPMCYLRLPAGSYRVEASYQGTKRTASVQAARVPGKPTRAVMTFPRDPNETIAPSAEEKAQARAPD